MSKPSLRPSVIVFHEPPSALHFVMSADGVVKSFEVDDEAVALVGLLDGTRDLGELEADLAIRVGEGADLESLLETFAREELLRPAQDDRTTLAPEERARYARQLALFEELEQVRGLGSPSALQERLRDATVAVLGAGATGSAVILALASAGVGTIRICDHDDVDLSNLNRQVLYQTDDVGRPKLDAALRRIAAVNPHVEVEPVDIHLDGPESVAPLVTGVDVVVSCADHPTSNIVADWVAAACGPPATPYVLGGGYAFHVGSLGPTVRPGVDPCWPCFRASGIGEVVSPDAVVLRPPSREVGTIASFSLTIGSLMAWEAILVLLAADPTMAGRVGEIDFATLETSWRTFVPAGGCAVCEPCG